MATSTASAPPTGSTPSSTATTSTSGITTGAAAGIGIGCAVAGAFIAVLLLILLGFRRGKRQRHNSVLSKSTAATQHDNYSKKTEISATPITDRQRSALQIIQSHQTPPAEDDTVLADYLKIRDRIAGHVESFYKPAQLKINGASSNLIGEILGSDDHPSRKLDSLIADAPSRIRVLRAVMAQIIVKRIDSKNELIGSLLPSESASILHKVAPDDPVRAVFLSQYRFITSFLLKSTESNRNSTASKEQQQASVQETVRTLDNALYPFADARLDNQERIRNMEEIVKRATRFGKLLASEPASWDITWAAKSLVVFPGLRKLTDEEGRILDPPKVLAKAEKLAP